MRYIYKSSVDGKIVSKEFAEENPDTTYKQAIDNEFAGLTHECDDPDCHVYGFIDTLKHHSPSRGNGENVGHVEL